MLEKNQLIEPFVSLTELEKHWAEFDITRKRLIHLAMEGLLETRVLCSDYTTELATDNTYADFPISYSSEYEVIDPIVLRDMIARGHDSIKPGTLLTPFKDYPKTFIRTSLEDLVVSKSEIDRFQSKYLQDAQENLPEQIPPQTPTLELKEFTALENLTWPEINITFLDDGDTISIEARGIKKIAHFRELNFSDRRKPNFPDKNWILFLRTAGKNGVISRNDNEIEEYYEKNMDKYCQTIRQRIREMFPSVVNDPFPNAGTGMWKLAFHTKAIDPGRYAFPMK